MVSVVIPTLNAGSDFPVILDRIRQQKGVGDIEIVVVDSGSTDGTLQACAQAHARTLTIDRKTFNHGGTRNLGISESRGEFVALLTQDAMPEDDNWLHYLVEAAAGNQRVSGAYSRQIPHPDTPLWVIRQMDEYGSFSDTPTIQKLTDTAAFDRMEPIEKLRLCRFDDVSSLIRRSVWERHPFPQAPFAEDLEWAKEEILRGNKIKYEPRSRVIHSHRRGALHEYRRSKIAHQRLCELFDLRLVPTFPLLVRYSLQNIVRHLKWAWGKPARLGDLLAVPCVAVASTLGQYIGAKAVANNRKGKK